MKKIICVKVYILWAVQDEDSGVPHDCLAVCGKR